jgi:hypothetical protein
MSARVKKKSAFTARLYDMRPGKEPWQQIGVEAMEVTVYLPEDRSYATTPRRFVSYGKTALRFTGARIDLSDKNLRRLCARLIEARKNLGAYIRKLARVYGAPS